MQECDVAIIGGGPAGLTAAIYTSRALLSTVVCEEQMPGGQMNLAEALENYPGFAQQVQGYDLGAAMAAQAQAMGARIEQWNVSAICRDGDRFVLQAGSEEVRARAVIHAAGSRWKQLGIPGETELTGRGVSYCATCDGAFFRGQEIAVVGGGDTAVKEALFLTRFAKKLYLVHRRDTLRAEKVMGQRLLAHAAVAPVWDSVATAVQETGGKVSGLAVRNVKTGAEQVLPVTGVFIFVGTQPRGELLAELAERDAQGAVIVDGSMATRTPGLYAAGDVRSGSPRQVATATGDGVTAALAAIAYIEAH
jgi:thioredoxin reductase (NADPH)